MSIYFSDYFNVEPSVVEEYGAFNISLKTDLPLFIDPFLLFNSNKPEYIELHNNIIRYLKFLRDKASIAARSKGLLKAWYMFPEVKQNWFGFTEDGNAGSGLGPKFAKALNKNLNTIFEDFGDERITEDSHLEKLCLIKSGVGRDNISDFTTNLIKEFLLAYTQEFARSNIEAALVKEFRVEKAKFNYRTETWESCIYSLPAFEDDYVILTPKDILTKDDTYMSSHDMYNKIELITNCVDNDVLRAQINNYLRIALSEDMDKKERNLVYEQLVQSYPQLIDYYIREKERNREEASSISRLKVSFSESVFISNISKLIELLQRESNYYSINQNSYEEAYSRVLYLKDVVENKDGYKLFYVDGRPIKKEEDIHIMYKLTCYNAVADINAEVNNGRGPVDFKSSIGAADKTLIEFKIASNSKLKKNLQNQVEIYEKANNTKKSIKVIVYYTETELNRVNKILMELGIQDNDNIVLIDARDDNKPSASVA